MQKNLEETKLEDGSQTKFWTYQTGENPEASFVLLFPAMGTPASYYEPLIDALLSKGINVITTDLRGIGLSSVRPGRDPDFGFKEMIELDMRAIIDKANSLFPDNKKFILGHSLGGQLGGLFMSKYPGQIEGLILIASCSVYYKGWSGLNKLKTIFGTQFFGLIATMLGYFPGHKLGFGGKGAKGVMQDWTRTARSGKYIINHSDHDFEASLKQLTIPILAISFSGDEFCPKKAVKNLIEKFNPASKVEHHHLTKSSVDGKIFNHYNWIKNNKDVVELISIWLQSEPHPIEDE